MPRKSALKHPLALLRKELGLVQKEMAVLSDVSPATIQSIELRRLEISERLASRISDLTGVSMRWLMAGDPVTPIPAAESRGHSFVEYSKRHFEKAQSRGMPIVTEEDLEAVIRVLMPSLVASFRSAKAASDENAAECFNRIVRAIEDLGATLKDDFGHDLDYEMARITQLTKEITKDMPKYEVGEICSVSECEEFLDDH